MGIEILLGQYRTGPILLNIMATLPTLFILIEKARPVHRLHVIEQ